MPVRASLLCASLAVTLAVAQEPAAEAPGDLPSERIVVLSLTGEIDALSERVLEKQVAAALEVEGLRFLVLEIDSPGGELQASRNIAFNLANLEAVTTVAYVRGRALSGATFAALGCDLIAFGPGGQMGDAMPLRVFQDLSVEVAEKLISPVRADLKFLAEKHAGYPALCAEAMADPALTVHRVELRDVERGRVDVVWLDGEAFEQLRWSRPDDVLAEEVVCKAGELLSVNALQAQDMGFCAWVSRDLDELTRQLQTEFSTGPLERSRESVPAWVDVVRLITWWPVKSLLFVVGIVALLFAFATPGTGLPEVTAAVCLGLVYGGSYLIGLADYVEVLLLLLGLGLLLAELFTPSFGLLGLSGLGCLLASLVLSYQTFVIPDTSFEWATLEASAAKTLFAALLSFLGVFVAMRFLPNTRLLRGLVHQHTLSAGAGEGAASGRLTTLAPEGALGRALTVLRPVGKVQIGEQVVGAVAEGDFVDPGDAVVVIGHRGSEAIVSRRPEVQAAPPPGATATDEGGGSA
ncbi:MAG: hypothetical protein KDD82_20305 [Planctomycetes bacterium]|nr:hypothetical protein [Planctomycetota bacterium]